MNSYSNKNLKKQFWKGVRKIYILDVRNSTYLQRDLNAGNFVLE